MLKFGIISIIVLINFGASAKTQAKVEDKIKTKESMSEFLDQFLGLKKHLVSDEEFQDPKNFSTISAHLKALSKAVKKTAHDPILNQENFKFSRDVLEDHVTETERVFQLGNKAYARWMTNSTLSICMSCHTQMPTQERLFAVFVKPNFFVSEFDQAEFMFATKNFSGASKAYRSLVVGYPKNALSQDKLEKCVQRELSYQLRIKRDFEAAKSAMVEFRKNKQLPEFLIRNLDAWTEQVGQWQKKKLPNVSTAKPEDIITFAKENLSIDANKSSIVSSAPRFISNLVVSSTLYEHLQKKPNSSAAPENLYWLAVIDREMTNSTFSGLADLYLKECMLKFPESSMAMKCYKEYEEEMVFGYTGSGGTNIPREVLEDLKYLKAFVESKGKVPLKRSMP